jgi:hypothetical protein
MIQRRALIKGTQYFVRISVSGPNS